MMMLMLVVMVMIVAAALAVLVVVMVMLMLVVMVMIVAAAFAVLVVVMMMLMLCLSSKRFQFRLQGGFLFHRGQDLFAGQLIPGGGDDRSLGVVFPQQRDGSFQLVLFDALGTGEDDGGSVLDLVVVKLAKVFHIHFDLARVRDGGKPVEDSAGSVCRLNRTDDVGQLADAGRLDQNTVGMVLFDYLVQCGRKIADKAAADTAGVHLIDLNTRILQKSPVDSDFAKLVFDQHQLFSLIGFSNQLFNQGCFAGAQKTGEDINFGHEIRLPFYLTEKYGLQWKIVGPKPHNPYYNPYL